MGKTRDLFKKIRQCIKKQRHSFANKGPYNQSYGFSSSHVWKWKLDHKEGWALKNWCFWTVVLERLLRVPWTTRRSNQSILMEINPDYSLEGLMLKLKLQYFGHLMRRASSLEKTLMLGKIRGRKRGNDRGWNGWMASLTQWPLVWASSGRCWIGLPAVMQSIRSQRFRHDWVTELPWKRTLNHTIIEWINGWKPRIITDAIS